jgi:hypothetical protein
VIGPHLAGKWAMYRCRYFVCALLLVSTNSIADKYSVNVTRKEQNFYRADGTNLTIETRFCYAFAYSEESILDSTSNVLHFLQSRDQCDIAAYYGPATVRPGKYEVTVTRKDSNFYEVVGTSYLLKTMLCLELALMENAILDVSGGRFGRLYFLDSQSKCDIEEVLSRRMRP